jgi:curved DNA-binding protein
MGGETVAQHGHDIESDILVTIDEVLHGSTRMIRLQRIDPRAGQSDIQTLRVKIPPGVREASSSGLRAKDRKAWAEATRETCI